VRKKAKAAAVNGKQPRPGPIVTNDLSINAEAQLKRLARHWDCSIPALIERWAANAERMERRLGFGDALSSLPPCTARLAKVALGSFSLLA
jgi:hypothetical protein